MSERRLEIWAPRASTVELVSAGERVHLTREEDGLFAGPAPPWGSDYALSLDGRHPVPDPRADLLPAGVHAPGRRIDHAAFAWSDDGFRAPPLGAGLLYELHVGSFSPEHDFDGAITHLDHLLALGVTHVQLMPVASFPGRWGWGYDGVGLFAPHATYGGPDGLKRLVDACHRRGLAVLLDVVYNHLGPDGNYLGQMGDYFTDRFHTPWGEAVNLDGPGSDRARAFFIDNALHWLEHYHLDGLRLDAVHAMFDTSARHFLEELAERVHALGLELGRPLVAIAESDLNDPRLVAAPEAGGYGLDAQWSDDLHHAVHAWLTGEQQGYYGDFGRLSDIAKALSSGFVYDGRVSRFRRRRHGRPLGGPWGERLLGYLQTHDQVGNRAQGERIGHLVSEGRLRLGAALVFCSPFVPMLFQGEEWNASSPFLYFTDHQSPELAAAVREGRRREFAAFGWRPEEVPDPQAEESFRRSVLDWSELDRAPHAQVLDWYRALSRLRRELPTLRDHRLDRVRVELDEAAGWIRVERGEVTLLANAGPAPLTLPRPPGACALSWPPALDLDAPRLTLPPDSTTLWSPALRSKIQR